MNKKFLLISASLFSVLLACSGKLTSEGESLDAIVNAKEAAVGKTHTLTLQQINVERNNEGAYVRLFDKGYKTIFVYVPLEMKNKVANLDRSTNYLYKFSVTKNDNYSTLSGKLIEVAGLDGKPVSSTLKDTAMTARMIILDGPDAVGKTFTLSLKFNKTVEDEGKKKIDCNSPDSYSTQVTCDYGDDLADKVGKLKESDKVNLKIKVDRVDWRIFGTLVSIE